jgi:hypothetical protein
MLPAPERTRQPGEGRSASSNAGRGVADPNAYAGIAYDDFESEASTSKQTVRPKAAQGTHVNSPSAASAATVASIVSRSKRRTMTIHLSLKYMPP